MNQDNESDAERVKLTRAEADLLLAPGANVHTFMQGGEDGIVLIGADRSRASLLKYADEGQCELAGPSAAKMRHGIVVFSSMGPVFCETTEAINTFSPCRN